MKSLERTLWEAADKLRKNLDAGEYKHIVLGLIFLKYISDGQWSYLKDRAKDGDPGIVKAIAGAMEEIEKMNPALQDIFPREYFRPHLDPCNLGQLIDLIDSIRGYPGDANNNNTDLLGKVYEYLLGCFAMAEGKKSGQFYTPPCIVKLLVEMLRPFKGSVYDPCCGSGGMFVQVENFLLAHQGRLDDIAIYGQESNAAAHRLCRMNLAIRGLDAANIQWNNQGSFLNDAHPNLKADYILANPPFNDSDWNGQRLTNDPRWQLGIPPNHNANFAWLQHIVYHLSPVGTAGVVLANGSLTTQTKNEEPIRKKMVENGIVECIVSLPDRLFYNTGIPACLWFLANNEKQKKGPASQILFIEARFLGRMISRRYRELTDDDIVAVAGVYHCWRDSDSQYKDMPGFCKSAQLKDIIHQEYLLTPARYVGIAGAEEKEDNIIPFSQKIKQLAKEFTILIKRGEEVDRVIMEGLKNIELLDE
jgi:type I restriction enzyme M protein